MPDVNFAMAEAERFELSRQLSRPTPLAGEPLQPLEYTSNGLPNQYIMRECEMQDFLKKHFSKNVVMTT